MKMALFDIEKCFKDNRLALWSLDIKNEDELSVLVNRKKPYENKKKKEQKEQLEKHILCKVSSIAYRYADRILEGPYAYGEPVIAKDPCYARLYAQVVLEHRFLEGEPAISTDPRQSYLYAIYVLQQRWLEAEDVIKSNSTCWISYRAWFRKRFDQNA